MSSLDPDLFKMLPTRQDFMFVFFATIAALLVYRWNRRRNLPPGPQGLPWLGNYFEAAHPEQHKIFLRWGKECGSDIISFTICGTQKMVVNTYDAALELFEHQGKTHADRDLRPLWTELLGQAGATIFLRPGDALRAHRRFFHHTFGPTAVKQFHPQIKRVVGTMLESLSSDPEKFREIVKQMTASLAILVTYGIDVAPKDDPLVTMLDQVGLNFREASTPGRFWVADVPFLKYIPAWMPGASFQRILRKWRQDSEDTLMMPFAKAKQDFIDEKPTESFVSVNLRNMKPGPTSRVEEGLIRDTAGSMYAAAADTTAVTILSVILSLIMHPEVHAKAQAEVEGVLGGEQRLPTFDDAQSLPYVTAVIKEAMRIYVVTPTAVPHKSTVDDEFRGYHIPKGTVLIGNTWAMMNDPVDYPNPTRYDPDRFMKDGKLAKTVRDPAAMAFGWGRRICPGRHLADKIVWLAVAGILATFDLAMKVDEDGTPIPPSAGCSSGGLLEPFECSIRPRPSRCEAGLYESTADVVP